MEAFDLFYIILVLLSLSVLAIALLLLKKRSEKLNPESRIVILWNSVISIFIILLFFSAGETYFRFFVDTTDSFGVNKITQRWLDRHFISNNFNTRDNIDYTLKMVPGKKRITFIGDSFTAGHGIKNVDDRFVNLIRHTYPEIEVHAFANPGFETIDQLEFLPKLEHDGYDFDLVVLIYNLNDIAPLIKETESVYDQIYSFQDDLGYLARTSYFINFLAFRFFAVQNSSFMNYYSYVKQGYFSDAWDQQQHSLNEIKNNLDDKGANLMVVTFPLLQQMGAHYEFENAHKKLNALWLSLDVPHLDLFPVFNKYEGRDLTINKFDAHPTSLPIQLLRKA